MGTGAGVAGEWDAGVARGKADVCSETSRQAWVVRRQNRQDFWCRRQAAIGHSWRASMRKRVRLAVLARRFVRQRRLRSVKLPSRWTRIDAAVAGLVWKCARTGPSS